MYRFIYSFLMVAVSTFSASTQKSVAAQVMERFRAKMEEAITSEMSFTLTGVHGRGVAITPIEGIIYRQGADYVMLNPQVEVYVSGDTKWIYTVDNNEAMIMYNDPASFDLAENPLALFSAQLSSEVTMGDTPAYFVDKGQEIVEITLTPKGKNNPYTSILLRINSKTLVPHSLKYNDKDGSWYEALITNFISLKQPFPEEYFVFSAKERPGVFVTDLR